MTLSEIKDKIDEVLAEFDGILDDESITSFPKAFKKSLSKLEDLANSVEDSIEEDKKNEDSDK